MTWLRSCLTNFSCDLTLCCNQSETRMLGSHCLQLTCLAWVAVAVAVEVNKYKRNLSASNNQD